MITSVLKDQVVMQEPQEYPDLAKEAVCDPVVVAVGNLSVPYVPVTPAFLPGGPRLCRLRPSEH